MELQVAMDAVRAVLLITRPFQSLGSLSSHADPRMLAYAVRTTRNLGETVQRPGLCEEYTSD